ncbi:MAG: hypothetical protein C4554_10110 [Dethiobacter sp.]|jgi:hypothetical protein|nr:MAG: hypothetical protein C4554_10110 [Dethiobacter sp.]
MFKFIKNTNGVALIIVMAIMAVTAIVISVILTIPSGESRVIFDYGKSNKVFYIAEAGADLAICEWRKYITSLRENNNGPPPVSVNTSVFINNWLKSKKDALSAAFASQYGLSTGTISIDYTSSKPAVTSAAGDYFELTIEANYSDTYKYKVRLAYDTSGNTAAFKGE